MNGCDLSLELIQCYMSSWLMPWIGDHVSVMNNVPKCPQLIDIVIGTSILLWKLICMAINHLHLKSWYQISSWIHKYLLENMYKRDLSWCCYMAYVIRKIALTMVNKILMRSHDEIFTLALSCMALSLGRWNEKVITGCHLNLMDNGLSRAM